MDICHYLAGYANMNIYAIRILIWLDMQIWIYAIRILIWLDMQIWIYMPLELEGRHTHLGLAISEPFPPLKRQEQPFLHKNA
jgi:hypothetical protein